MNNLLFRFDKTGLSKVKYLNVDVDLDELKDLIPRLMKVKGIAIINKNHRYLLKVEKGTFFSWEQVEKDLITELKRIIEDSRNGKNSAA
jgi:hypothetical protein